MLCRWDEGAMNEADGMEKKKRKNVGKECDKRGRDRGDGIEKR